MTEANFQKEREQKEDVIGIFQTEVAEKNRTIRATGNSNAKKKLKKESSRMIRKSSQLTPSDS